MNRLDILLATAAAALALTGGCQSEKRTAPTPTQVQPATPGLLGVGDPLPEFETVAHEGTAIRSKALIGEPVVIYFYPKDETPG